MTAGGVDYDCRSSTWFIIGFVVLLVVVGALVIFFVAGGLNPSGGANSTDTSMPDELGTGGMTQMSAMTTAGGEGAPNAMLRAYESLSEPVYSQLAFTEQRSMYTDQDNRCPYEMFTVGAQVIEFRGTIWNKNLDIHPVLQGSDPEDHFMVRVCLRCTFN